MYNLGTFWGSGAISVILIKTFKSNGGKIQMVANSHLVLLLEDLTEMRTPPEIKLPLKPNSSTSLKLIGDYMTSR